MNWYAKVKMGHTRAFNIIELIGEIFTSGFVGLGVFVLPADMRPAGDVYFATVSNSAFGSVLINASGGVIPTTGSTSWFSLEGISFRGS
ncbi:MAG: hypothetical protein ACRCTX_26335 [Afipia sp.]